MTVALRQRPLARVVIGIVQAGNGCWLDLSDMSTLFQDAAGTIPVTAVEQPVGKIIDKSGNGNHATQSITASQPTLSARYNLLTKTEDFADAIWAPSASAFATVAYAGSNGYSVARNSSTTEARIRQSITINPAPVSITLRVKIKANSVSWVKLRLLSIDSSPSVADDYAFFNVSTGVVGDLGSLITSAKIYPAEDGFFVCEISGLSLPSSSGAPQLIDICPAAYNAAPATGGSVGESIYVKQAELVLSSNSNMKYQRVNTTTDYDTNPAYFPKYLRFDGIDDYLNLPYMGLYTGGAASIIAARDAVSQSTDTYVISERSTTDADPKYFPSRQLASGGNMDSYISDDTAAVVLDTTGSAFGGAADKVIRSVVDTGSNLKLYKNGSLAADDNYTRAGTLTLNNTTLGASVSTTTSNYASMKLYGLIITKSALTNAQRVRCERFLAQKAGVML